MTRLGNVLKATGVPKDACPAFFKGQMGPPVPDPAATEADLGDYCYNNTRVEVEALSGQP